MAKTRKDNKETEGKKRDILKWRSSETKNETKIIFH